MKPSKEFQQIFLSAPQLNPSNSGKGKRGNYKRVYNKTVYAKTKVKLPA